MNRLPLKCSSAYREYMREAHAPAPFSVIPMIGMPNFLLTRESGEGGRMTEGWLGEVEGDMGRTVCVRDCYWFEGKGKRMVHFIGPRVVMMATERNVQIPKTRYEIEVDEVYWVRKFGLMLSRLVVSGTHAGEDVSGTYVVCNLKVTPLRVDSGNYLTYRGYAESVSRDHERMFGYRRDDEVVQYKPTL